MSIASINPIIGAYNDYAYIGGIQSFTAPVAGVYKLETWGAQGGCSLNQGGYGGYSVGYVQLTKNQTIYIAVGGTGSGKHVGSAQANYLPGGYNGGGNIAYGNGGTGYLASGGGCTSITLTNRGVLSNFASYIPEILIVAGGGGGDKCVDGYGIYGGGYGGGLTGQTAGDGGTGGSQTSAGTSQGAMWAGFGQGSGTKTSAGSNYSIEGGGGGGLYGGGSGWQDGGGSGGSGFTGGVPAITINGVTYSASMSNSIQQGNGLARITFAAYDKIFNLYYNGSAVQQVFYNGVEVSSLVYNGKLIYGLSLS